MTFGYHISFRLFDAGVIANLGPYGIAKTVTHFSQSSSRLQSGFVFHYAFVILISITALTWFVFFGNSATGGTPFEGLVSQDLLSEKLGFIFLFSAGLYCHEIKSSKVRS